MTRKTEIRPDDVLDVDTYAAQRPRRRDEMIARKRLRRLPVGPNATLHFENFDTMLYQVQEMLHVERGGEEQLQDELRAYNPLVPKGNELVATFMLEFPDAATRVDRLRELTNIEETISLEIGGEEVPCNWETDVDRTAPDGKTSSIHFIRFHLTPEQAERFRDPSVPVMVKIAHPNYLHAAGITGAMREELARDL